MTFLRVVASVLLVYGIACVGPVPARRSADLLISEARLLTRPGEILPRSTVVVTDGIIQEVVAGEFDLEATTVIDGENYTVLPGLIDSHVHLLTQAPIVDGDAAMAAIMASMAMVLRQIAMMISLIETARAAATPPPRQGGAHV